MRILDKKLPSHAILVKIWYVGGCISLIIWWLCQFLVPHGNQKSRLLFDRTYHFNNTWEGEYWIKNYPAMPILAKIWYVGGCTSQIIWWLCQFLVPPGNQKSRLLFDRTYHFNNTWEGEYWIKITQQCDFGKNLVCQRVYISDNLSTLPILSAIWKPEIQAVIWQNLTF